MAITNPTLMEGWDVNDTNSVAPSSTLVDDGYPFQGIPASSEHNYLFGNAFDNLNYIKKNGVYRWDSTLTYKKQAMIARDEVIYFSLTDGNTNNDPRTSPTFWIDWVSLSNAAWKTTGVTNAGSISTILATPYFGTASSPSDGDVLSIRITTGEITFPSNVKINVNGSDYTLVGTVPFSGSDSTLRILDVYFDGTSFYQKIPAATTSQAGIVKLSSALDSTSEVIAATSKAVKDAKDATDESIKIESGSSIHSGGIIKHKILSITIPDGSGTGTALHGISSAGSSHRIIDVRSTRNVGGNSVWGGEGDNYAFLSSYWYASDSTLTLNRGTTSNTHIYQCYITYV
jgi:hypothetical protein